MILQRCNLGFYLSSTALFCEGDINTDVTTKKVDSFPSLEPEANFLGTNGTGS